MKVATRKAQVTALLFGGSLGLVLSQSFLSAANRLGQIILPASLSEIFSFPLIALLFYLSLPKKRVHASTLPTSDLLLSFPVAIGIALIFGWVLGEPSSWKGFLWVVIAVPLGEELLFRGWLTLIAERLWKGQSFSLTNRLPVSVWVSSAAFATWHWQNFSAQSPGFTAFQIFYTFFVGIWLGYLNDRKNLALAMLAHSLINLASLAGGQL